MHPRRTVIAVLLLTVGLIVQIGVPANALAQTAFGLKWFGELRHHSSPRMLALGGLSAVAPWGGEEGVVGQLNPALLANVQRVLYSFTWELGQLSGSYSDGEGTLKQSGPRLVGLALPVGRGLVTGISLQSHTTSEFEIHSDGMAPGEIPVRFDYKGTGGLSQAIAGVAWKAPSGAVSIGLESELLFGSVKQEWRINFEPTGYSDSSDRLQRQHFGSRWRLGLQVIPAERLKIGMAVGTRGAIGVEHIFITSSSEADTVKGELKMGETLLVGAGWAMNDLWSAYADYRHAAWNRMEWTEEPVSIGSSGAANDFSGFSADRDFGIGIEKHARPSEEQTTFWDTFPIRAGLRLGTIYAPDLNGGSVSQWYATLGTTRPIGRQDNAWIDLALVIGRRTSADAAGASESFWRIQIGVTGAERWFLPPQR